MKTLLNVCLLGLLASPAWADPVILFDDLYGPTTSIGAIPAGYHGLNWIGLGVADGVHFDANPSGYQAGVVSSNNIVYPTNGNFSVSQNGSITGGLFDFLSAYMTSVLYDNLNLEAKGYIHGTLVYDTNYTLSATTPTLIHFNFYGVDEVNLITSGGSQHPGYVNGFDEGFAMDNVSVVVYVPYAPLIQNGGFETGDLTDWSNYGNTNFTFISTNSLYAHSGKYGLQAGPSTTLGYLAHQLLQTPVTSSYAISFWLDNQTGQTPSEFLLEWEGATLFDLTNLPAFGWNNVNYNVTSFTPRSGPVFGFRDDHSYFGIDDVSVTPNSPVQNGGFESGDYSGWTISGNTNGNSIFTGASYARSGSDGAALGAVGSLSYLSQTLSTYTGQLYLLSFWLNRPSASGSPTNEFLASWNGQTLFDQTNLPASGWTNLHFVVLSRTFLHWMRSPSCPCHSSPMVASKPGIFPAGPGLAI